MIAQQVDDGLNGLADAHDAGSQGVAGQISAEAAQQCGLAVQRHAELILAGDDPGLSGLTEQAPRDDACGCRCDLKALVTARAGVLDAVVLKHTDLLGNDVHLFADLGANFYKRMTIVGAHALVLRQLVADDLARQRRVQWLPAALLALMAGNGCGLFFVGLRGQALIGRRECFSLVEEQVLLLGSARLALGREQLTLQGPQSLKSQVSFVRCDPQRAGKRITFSDENGEFFDGDASKQGHMNFEPYALQLFLLLTKI